MNETTKYLTLMHLGARMSNALHAVVRNRSRIQGISDETTVNLTRLANAWLEAVNSSASDATALIDLSGLTRYDHRGCLMSPDQAGDYFLVSDVRDLFATQSAAAQPAQAWNGELPELPEWSKMDNLGNIVPSDVRKEMQAYALQAIGAAVAGVRTKALEDVVLKLEAMNESSGDSAARDNRAMYISELDREYAISDCIKAVRSLQNNQ